MSKPDIKLGEIQQRAICDNQGKVTTNAADWDWLMETILKLLEDNRRMAETLNWIMPKVHQGNHEGSFDECPKATCTAYREALTAHEQTMKELE